MFLIVMRCKRKPQDTSPTPITNQVCPVIFLSLVNSNISKNMSLIQRVIYTLQYISKYLHHINKLITGKIRKNYLIL